MSINALARNQVQLYNVTLCIMPSLSSRTHGIVPPHYDDVMMSAMASQITSLTVVCSNVYSGSDQRKHQSASLAFGRGIHRLPVNSPHKGPVTRKMFPFVDVIMELSCYLTIMSGSVLVWWMYHSVVYHMIFKAMPACDIIWYCFYVFLVQLIQPWVLPTRSFLEKNRKGTMRMARSRKTRNPTDQVMQRRKGRAG